MGGPAQAEFVCHMERGSPVREPSAARCYVCSWLAVRSRQVGRPTQDFVFLEGGGWCEKNSSIRSAALMSWVTWPFLGTSKLPGVV
jgi:hypothetical protein